MHRTSRTNLAHRVDNNWQFKSGNIPTAVNWTLLENSISDSLISSDWRRLCHPSHLLTMFGEGYVIRVTYSLCLERVMSSESLTHYVWRGLCHPSHLLTMFGEGYVIRVTYSLCLERVMSSESLTHYVWRGLCHPSHLLTMSVSSLNLSAYFRQIHCLHNKTIAWVTEYVTQNFFFRRNAHFCSTNGIIIWTTMLHLYIHYNSGLLCCSLHAVH